MNIPLARRLLIGAIILAPFLFGAVEPWATAIITLAVLAAAFLSPGIPGPLFLSLLVATAFAAVGILRPSSVGGPIVAWSTSAPLALAAEAVSRWFVLACVVWAACSLRNRSGRHNLALAIFLAGVVLAVVGLVQEGSGTKLLYGIREIRFRIWPFGPYINRNHAANFMMMALLAGLGLMLERHEEMFRAKRKLRQDEYWAKQALLTVALIILAVGLARTSCRTALVLAAAGALFVFLLGTSAGKQARRQTFLVTLLISLGVVFSVLASPALRRFDLRDLRSGFIERIEIVRVAAALIEDRMLWGTGGGGWILESPPYRSPAVGGILEHAHSDALEIVGEIGFLAGGLFILAVMVNWVSAVRRWQALGREAPWSGAGLLAAVLAFFIHSLVDFSFQSPANAFAFICILGTWEGDEINVETSPRVLWGMRGLILVAAVLAVPRGIASAVAASAKNAPDNIQIRRYAMATQLDPRPIYRLQEANAHWRMAEANPDRRQTELRLAVTLTAQALSEAPFDDRILAVQAGLLSNLGRPQDARRLSERIRQVP